MVWTTPATFTAGQVVAASDMNTNVRDNPSFLFGDLAWTNVAAFTNSWGAGVPAPAYILLGRVVYLRGQVTAGTASTSAFTLPSGYRPLVTGEWTVPTSAHAANAAQIATTGTVTIVTSTPTWLNLSFPVV